MFHRPPKKYSEYLVNVEQSIDWMLKMLWKLKKGEFTQNLQQVTDEGNTTTNTIDTAGTTSDYFQLDTTATPTLLPGMFGWNDVDGTANLRLKGNNVTLQIGQETLARVVNKTGADLLESQYKVVRVRIASEGGAQGQRLAVVLAQGNNDPDSTTTLGIVTENISNNQEGFITIFGNVNEINTTGSLQGETWVDGDVLYLSPTTPGSLTKVKPIAPDHSVVMGYVIYAHAVHGKIFVKVDNGYELDELHNVRITSVANNNLLQYDSTLQVWKNVAASVAVPTPTLAQVTTAGNTTTNAITLGGLTVNLPSLNYVKINSATAPTFNTYIGTSASNQYAWFTNVRYNGSWVRDDNTRTAWRMGMVTDTLSGSGSLYVDSFDTTGGIITPFLIKGNGNIGINNTNPIYTLHLNGTNKIQSPTSNSSEVFIVSNTAGTSNAFAIRDNGTFTAQQPGGSQYIHIAGTGNILINNGTTDAGYKLDVNGTGRYVGSLNIWRNTTTNGFVLSSGSNDTLQWNNGTWDIQFNSGTPVTILRLSNGVGGVSYLTSKININAPNVISNLGASLGVYGNIITSGSITAASAVARGVYFNNTLVAAANNDVLVGLDINPTFTNGAFTGVQNWGLRVQSSNILLSTTKGIYFGNSGYGITGEVGTGSLSFYTNSTERLKIDNAGAITAGGSARFANVLLTGSNIQLLNGLWYFNIENDGNGLQVKNVSGSNTVPFRIFKNDNVAIGTTTDAGYKLDVNGTVRLKDRLVIDSGSTLDYPITLTTSKTGNNGTVYLANTSSTGQVLMVFHNEVGGNYSYNSYGLLLYGGSGAGDPLFGANRQNRFMIAADGASNLGMYLGTLSAQPLVFGTNNVERIRINSSGSVGIGTTSPSYKLQVVGDIALSGNLVPTAGSQTLGTFTNRFGDVWAGGLIVGTTFYGDNYQTASGTMFFKDGGGVERMRMTSVGNFLIGTTIDPGYKLTVNGDINTSGVFRVGGVAGWTGVITIPTNPPGQQNVDVQGGIIVNVF